MDLSQISDETFTEPTKLGLLERVQKHIFTRDLAVIATSLVRLMKASRPEHELFNGLVYYMRIEGKTSDVNQAIKTLQSIEDYREDIMNAAQQLKQQGFQEGLHQGLKQVK